MSTRRLIGFAVLGAAALAVLTAAPAAAHVTVQPGQATKGGYTKLAFRVPNESATAGTVKLEVSFPQDTPIPSARTKPMAGWTAAITSGKLANPVKTDDGEITDGVTSITWTAQPGVRIGPTEFTEFEVSVGPLPDADTVLLATKQTYDDGTVADWSAPPPAAGGAEPEHPAPLLTLVAEQSEAATSQATPAAQVTQVPGHDNTARWLGGLGLAVGALGFGLGAGAVLARRRTT